MTSASRSETNLAPEVIDESFRRATMGSAFALIAQRGGHGANILVRGRRARRGAEIDSGEEPVDYINDVARCTDTCIREPFGARG